MKIGIIKEGKVPVDHRVPLTPQQARNIADTYGVDVVVQRNDIRCFADADYAKEGLALTDTVADCDVILGVKEVPIDSLISNKTHFFFSHTIKAQAYNRDLLRAVLQKNVTLVDWETLTDKDGARVIAFGRWAGIVGAYNALWTYGKRYRRYDLRRAHTCRDYKDLQGELKKTDLPAIKIAITGGGRVAKGAVEVLLKAGIRQVSPTQFLQGTYEEPVFVQLDTQDYHQKIDDEAFDIQEFYVSPQLYESDFLKYAQQADMLIACAYWNPAAPVLFTKSDMQREDFTLKIIADITCDIEGSIPSTKKSTTIADPLYDYNPSYDKVESACSDEGNITVMAVDNLPCELPRDASESFGEQFIAHVMPALMSKKDTDRIANATIAKKGTLTKKYSYLQHFVDEG